MALPRMSFLVPVLRVSSLESGAEFFAKFGFQQQWAYGEPPFYAGLYHETNDGMVIHLTTMHSPVVDAVSLYIQVDDVQPYYNIARAAGCEFIHDIGDNDYGMRDFGIRSPDGFGVSFGQEIERA